MSDLSSLNKFVQERHNLIQEAKTIFSKRYQKWYHHESKSHIFYQAVIGPFGVRGIGAFADEAYILYMESLDQELNMLSNEELKELITEYA